MNNKNVMTELKQVNKPIYILSQDPEIFSLLFCLIVSHKVLE